MSQISIREGEENRSFQSNALPIKIGTDLNADIRVLGPLSIGVVLLIDSLDGRPFIQVVNDKIEVLISDTVGFIRKLPHNLVASFRTTLSEIKDADLIIKVVDISANDYKGHIATIENTLEYLKANKCPSILVFNKILMLTQPPSD